MGVVRLPCYLKAKLPMIRQPRCESEKESCRLKSPKRRKNQIPPYLPTNLFYQPRKTFGLVLSQCTISLSSGELFNTVSIIGLPKNLGSLLNTHILSFGHGLCACFSCNQPPNSQGKTIRKMMAVFTIYNFFQAKTVITGM